MYYKRHFHGFHSVRFLVLATKLFKTHYAVWCHWLYNLHVKPTSISRRLRLVWKNCERCYTVISKDLSDETIITIANFSFHKHFKIVSCEWHNWHEQSPLSISAFHTSACFMKRFNHANFMQESTQFGTKQSSENWKVRVGLVYTAQQCDFLLLIYVLFQPTEKGLLVHEELPRQHAQWITKTKRHVKGLSRLLELDW